MKAYNSPQSELRIEDDHGEELVRITSDETFIKNFKGGGTDVTPNIPLVGTEPDLTSLQIEDTNYRINNTDVTPNPLLTGNEQDLTSLQIANTKYRINNFADFRHEGKWTYRIFLDGSFEAWYYSEGDPYTIGTTSGSLYRSESVELSLPSYLADNVSELIPCNINISHKNYPCWAVFGANYTTHFSYYALSGGYRNLTSTYITSAYVIGKVAIISDEDSTVVFRSVSDITTDSPTFSLKATRKAWNGKLQYKNGNDIWTEWDGSSIQSINREHVGNIIELRGIGNSHISASNIGSTMFQFTVGEDVTINITGTIENLLDYKEVAKGNIPPMDEYCFYRLFALQPVNAEIHFLSTNLSNYCYFGMFINSKQHTTLTLPATKLSAHCYEYMFSGCTNLLTAHTMTITHANEYSCAQMYNRCGLTSLGELNIGRAVLKQSCFSGMFMNCTNLEEIPSLYQTYLFRDSLFGMFSIRLSPVQTEQYTTPYRVPAEGNATLETGTTMPVFKTTDDSTFQVNITYYTDKVVV